MAGRGPSPQVLAAKLAAEGDGNDRVPRAPNGLQDPGKALWRQVCGELRLDALELATLHRACLLADRAGELEALIGEQGLMIAGSQGQQRIHPALGEQRQIHATVGRLLATMKPASGSAASSRAVHAARRRWG
jgi:hypothetical protein